MGEITFTEEISAKFMLCLVISYWFTGGILDHYLSILLASIFFSKLLKD